MPYTPIPASGTLAVLSGLTATQIVYGSATGTGTSSADLKWDDSSKVLSLGRAGTARLSVTIGGGGAVDISGTDDRQVSLISRGTGPLVFKTNNTDRITVGFQGEIGIGGVATASQHLLLERASAKAVVNATSGSATAELQTAGTLRSTWAASTTESVLNADTGDLYLQTRAVLKDVILRPVETERVRVRADGDVVIGNGNAAATVLAANAVAGFLRITTSDGTPTGAAVDGALHLDSTNDIVYIRSGGAWIALN